MVLAFVFCATIIGGSSSLALFYTDNEKVVDLATTAFKAFGFAFVFDWTQCQLGGSIKAVGAQG